MRENRYAGTAEQAGVFYLQLRGKRIAEAVLGFHGGRGKWPASLSELVDEKFLEEQELLYPRRYDLPDRRDILGFTDGIRWIYLPPKDKSGRMPLLIAPLPYTSSMGQPLEQPKRIVVGFDSIPDRVDEDKIAQIIQSLVTP